MVIATCLSINSSDVRRESWGGIRRFHNSVYCEKRLNDLHNVPKNKQQNIKKQARQIRQCLIQAEQYFSAANSVGPATRPVLIYYGILSFALAEILVKQNGCSSLDAARGENAHHGLDLRKDGNPSKKVALKDSAAALRAVPSVKPDSRRFGTFDLWHRTQRDAPTIGRVSRILENGTQESVQVIGVSSDERSSLVPLGGLTLLDCLCTLPHLARSLAVEGVVPKFARGQISREQYLDGKSIYKCALHPGSYDVISQVQGEFKFPPNLIDEVYYNEMPSGLIFEFRTYPKFEGGTVNLPSATQYRADEIFFFPSDPFMNEFGNIYYSMFIVGNYARYFPDEWMEDIEASSPLFHIVSELMEFALERVPLLVLNELTGIYHVTA